MDGLLIIDKPVGPTSHDVVARVRHILGEPRVGHAGTLDPMATGVLTLVVGRGTRLAQFLNVDDKTYDAVLRLGVATDTGDAQGQPIGTPYAGVMPSRDTIDAALAPFRGTFLQQPPAFSAKKIDGRRSHRLARAHARALAGAAAPPAGSAPLPGPPLPAPATVTAHSIEIVQVEGERVALHIECSGGFYVRSLAHDLGEALGTRAHLVELRRTQSSGCRIADAVPFGEIVDGEAGRTRAVAALLPLEEMLPDLPCLVLTALGTRHASSGQTLGPADVTGAFPHGTLPPQTRFRLVDPSGSLVGIAAPGAPGLLHPAVVLV